MLPKSLACGCGGELLTGVLTGGLPARVCPVCGGALLGLDDYRAWRQSRSAQRQPVPKMAGSLPPFAEEGGRARPCPACAGPMTRYRAAAGSNLRLDRCSHCQLVWLDGGEWAALAAAGLDDRLDNILTDAWQRRIQLDVSRQRREAALRLRLGDEVVEELQRIQSWLHSRPNGRELLALLGGEPI